MRSEVRVIGPSWRIALTFGAFGSVTMIVLALLFREVFTFGFYVLFAVGGLSGGVVIGLYALRYVTHFIIDIRRQNLQLAMDAIKIQQEQVALERQRLHLDVLQLPQGGRIAVPAGSRWQVLGGGATTQAGPLVLPELPQLPQLMDVVADYNNIFIHGPQGCGKTTLITQLIQQRLQAGDVTVIDPHAKPDQWRGCTVIGAPKRYDAIAEYLPRLSAMLEERYHRRHSGDESYRLFTVVFDEFATVNAQLSRLGVDLADTMLEMLTETRKVSMSLIFASHMSTTRGTALDRMAQLLDGVAQVKPDIASGTATVNGQPVQWGPNAPSIDTREQQDRLFVALVQSGKSGNEAAMQAYGHSYSGSYYERGKRALERYG